MDTTVGGRIQNPRPPLFSCLSLLIVLVFDAEDINKIKVILERKQGTDTKMFDTAADI